MAAYRVGDNGRVSELGTQLEHRLREALAGGPSLRLAILFGSAAAGTLRASSDVDLAIIPLDPDLPLKDELALQARLEQIVGRTVDLVRLDHASTLLRWQVASKGRVLLAEPATERVLFLAQAASDYGDFAPALEQASRRFARRLARPDSSSRPKGPGTTP